MNETVQTTRTGEPPLAGLVSWLVLSASFGLSAATWIALAVLAGFDETLTLPDVGAGAEVTLRLAWLMPLSVDGYVTVALLLWMAPVPARVASFARTNTYAAAGIGVVAQSCYHALTTWSDTGVVWRAGLAAVVGALPPAVAGLAVHMRALVRRESGRPAPSELAVGTVARSMHLARERPAEVAVPVHQAVTAVAPPAAEPVAVSAAPTVSALPTLLPVVDAVDPVVELERFLAEPEAPPVVVPAPPVAEPVEEPAPPAAKPARAAKRQPSAYDRVAAAIRRSPNATDATIAARTGLTERTVRQHRTALEAGKRGASVAQASPADSDADNLVPALV